MSHYICQKCHTDNLPIPATVIAVVASKCRVDIVAFINIFYTTDKLLLTMLIIETFLNVQKVTKPFNDFMRRFYVIQVIAQFSIFCKIYEPDKEAQEKCIANKK